MEMTITVCCMCTMYSRQWSYILPPSVWKIQVSPPYFAIHSLQVSYSVLGTNPDSETDVNSREKIQLLWCNRYSECNVCGRDINIHMLFW